jgi:uncharacterized protein YlxP (DUF503 family)
MFVGLARLSLSIQDTGSIKSKRQVLRKVQDRLRARFNLAVAEVEDQGVHERATVAVSVLSNERHHANDQLEKIIQFVEDMYLAPVVSRETEVISFGEQELLPFAKGDRSLAEAEGLGDWDSRHVEKPVSNKKATALSPEERRAKARSLRNRRDWETKEKG